jgi:hypothetical protein
MTHKVPRGAPARYAYAKLHLMHRMQLDLKPSQAKVREYFSALHQFGQLSISHETAVRQAFAALLDGCARQLQWKLVHEVRIPLPNNKSIIVDEAILDAFTLKHGYWEAKDSDDNLEKEVNTTPNTSCAWSGRLSP